MCGFKGETEISNFVEVKSKTKKLVSNLIFHYPLFFLISTYFSTYFKTFLKNEMVLINSPFLPKFKNYSKYIYLYQILKKIFRNLISFLIFEFRPFCQKPFHLKDSRRNNVSTSWMKNCCSQECQQQKIQTFTEKSTYQLTWIKLFFSKRFNVPIFNVPLHFYNVTKHL